MLSYKTVLDSAKFCTSQLEELGYNVPKGINFRTSSRLTRALGNCAERRFQGVVMDITISLSASLPLEVLNDVMIHELIHATVGGRAKHGPLFQAVARKVNHAYGYSVGTYASNKEKVAINSVRVNNGTHVTVECSQCGKTHTVTNRHGVAKHPENYRCRCGGALHIKD